MYSISTEEPLLNTVSDYILDKNSVIRFPATLGFNGTAMSNDAVIYLNVNDKGLGLVGDRKFYSNVYSVSKLRIPAGARKELGALIGSEFNKKSDNLQDLTRID